MPSAVEVFAAAVRERNALRSHCERAGKAMVEIGQRMLEEPDTVLSAEKRYDLDWRSFADLRAFVERLLNAEQKVVDTYNALSEEEREVVTDPSDESAKAEPSQQSAAVW